MKKETTKLLTYQNYLHQMIERLEDDYAEMEQEEAKRKHKGLRDKKAYCFEEGERLGYKEILEKFRHHAPLYGINLKDVNAIGAKEPNLLAYQSYSYKVLRQLLDSYRELEQEKESKNINARNDAESKLISGRTLAYYCVLERFRTYAKLFEIPRKEIGLAKIIPLFRMTIKQGWTFRFNSITGYFVAIHPEPCDCIKTAFWPQEGIGYYLKQLQLYANA